jgi:sulfane dehydrogenase subunit SoxC
MKLNRRHLLKQAIPLGMLVQSASGKSWQPTALQASFISEDPTKIPGASVGTIGTRSPFEQHRKMASDISARTPLQNLYGMLTPSDLHFERDHAGVPSIDPSKHELLIHGMVEKPLVFTLADLKRFPSVSRIAFLECSGNYRSKDSGEITPQEICGLTSQSEWTGVKLSTLLREVGASDKATWFLAEGGDAAVMTRSVPLQKGWDDAIIAYAQNGEAVRPEQGYPFRLFLPGYEGNANVKWLRRIEISDEPFHTREETSKYTEIVGEGKIRQFSFVMDARSIITYPSYPQSIEKGWIEIQGIAWSGRGKVQSVEISVDGGKKWQQAELQSPILDKAHTRFRYLWHWHGQETVILSRTTDETGYQQPTLQTLKQARGGYMGYHYNPITGWLLRPNGEVLFQAT